MTKIKFKWESLDSRTSRAKVIGGWLVSSMDDLGGRLCFVPDKDHEWELEE